MTIEQRLQEARQLHQRGELASAIRAYGEVLSANPALPEVWHLKGMAEHQSGDLGSAQASVARAIARGGERPGFLLLEGGILHDRGELAAAEERYAKVVAARPDWPVGHLELGRVHLEQGKPQQALQAFQAATRCDPRNVRAWNNLGIALQALERLDEAVRAFTHTLSLDPRYALAHFNLARLYNLRADAKRALEHAQAAVRHDEGLVEGWLLLGDIHRRSRESEAALAAYAMAIRAAPGHHKPRNAHAEMLAEVGRVEDARRAYREVSAEVPANLKAALGANLLLPQHYDSAEHLEAVRREYASGLERLHEAAPRFVFPNAERALAEARWTNFYLAYQGRNDVALQRRYGEFQRKVLERAAPELYAPRKGNRGDRIRVGFLSHFFFNCTAGRYFASWVTRLDPARFETFVYYTNEWVADDTRAIAAAAGTFRHLPGRPLHTLAQHVAADALDILVYPELGMHAETYTLAALRLAPVQCAGWGHPDTTGLPTIDWFLSSEPMEPADAAQHYTESLAVLPGLGTRYALPAEAAPGTRADFGIPEGRTAYLVPQSLFKIHPDNDELIAEVLAQDDRGVAVMFASSHDLLTQAFATRLARAFRKRRLDLNERVVFLAPTLPHQSYLRLNRLCDVMLDTLHWSGGNTSLDALSNGLPVVTLPGALMRGRQSQAMLRILGAGELVAESTEDLVAKAVALGRDADRRHSLSETLLANRGALFERDEPITALEAFFERAYVQGAG
ncbi:MAG TPA: tetratricopeptide repeat protein [Usitatibacter sp.]|nr:tetratricopeptide repeat protein [Usitatibacter sp.]